MSEEAEALIGYYAKNYPQSEAIDALYGVAQFCARLAEVDWLRDRPAVLDGNGFLRIRIEGGYLIIFPKIRPLYSRGGFVTDIRIDTEDECGHPDYRWSCQTSDVEVALFALARAPR